MRYRLFTRVATLGGIIGLARRQTSMEKHGLDAALERINAGAPIPTVEPSQIEHVWER